MAFPAGLIRQEPVSLLVGTGVLGLLLSGPGVSVIRAFRFRPVETDLRFDPATVERDAPLRLVLTLRGGTVASGTILTGVLRSGSRRYPFHVRMDGGGQVGRIPARFHAVLPGLPRGLYQMESLSFLVSDPLGLSSVVPPYRVHPDRVRVLPGVSPVAMTDSFQRRGSQDVLPSSSWVRSGERIDIRPYVPGDDTSRIHWSMYAHTGELFFRIPEELPPPSRMVALVIQSIQPEAAMLDQVVEYALGAAADLETMGYQVVLGARTGVGGDAFRAGAPEAARSILAGLDHREGRLDPVEWSRFWRDGPRDVRANHLLITTGLASDCPGDLRGDWIVLVPEGGIGGVPRRLAHLDCNR